MQLRVARHTERLEEVVGFYRDGIGLTEIGGFHDHDGYDRGFLAVPGTDAHRVRQGPLPAPSGVPDGEPRPPNRVRDDRGDDRPLALETIAGWITRRIGP
jgi:hypothetical protein